MYNVQCNAQSVVWHRVVVVVVTLSATLFVFIFDAFFLLRFRCFCSFSRFRISTAFRLMKIPNVAYKLAVFRVIICNLPDRPRRHTYSTCINNNHIKSINIFIHILASCGTWNRNPRENIPMNERPNEWMHERDELLHFETDYYAFSVKFFFTSRSVYVEYLIMFVDIDFVFFFFQLRSHLLFAFSALHSFSKTFSTFSVFFFIFLVQKLVASRFNTLHAYLFACDWNWNWNLYRSEWSMFKVANVTITALELW